MNISQIFVGNFTLKFYGIFLAIGFLVVALLYYQRLKIRNLDQEFFVHHFWRWIMGGVFFGRIFSLIADPDIITRNVWLAFFAFWDGGFAMFGVLAGFLLLMWHDLRKAKQNMLLWTDALIMPLLMGVMILDFGAFLTGAVYGTETILPWGVQYETFGVDILSPVHPVTLYGLALHFALLRWARRRFEPFLKHTGKLTYSSMFLFFLIEFVLHFFRGDPAYTIFGIRIEQIISLMLALFAFIWVQRYKKK